MNRIFLIAFGFLLCTLTTRAQSTASARWKGFEKVGLTVGGHQAYIVKPGAPLAGNPWVWRTSFPDWHTDMDSILLAKGFYVAYLSIDDQYGSSAAMQVYDQFYALLTDKYAFAAKAALEAVSRGALYAYAWAKRNPDKVSCIYAETPVCDIKSWPGGKGKGPGDTAAWRQFKQVFHFTEEQAVAFKDNPIDNLEGLAAFKVPVLHVIGPNDELAPYNENTLPFSQRYIAAGGSISVYPVTKGPQELRGHHFPIDRPDYYASFIINNSYPVKKPLPYSKYFTTPVKLANFYYAATIKKKATVAFLGGSITFNPGWREKVCQYLKERFPETDFHFIAAGIPSLGSLPHAFRLQRDVLDSGKVDLMFIEAAVNDHVNGTDSLTQVRDLDGIVRHARKSNPAMDMVLMALADPDKTNDYNHGKTPAEISNHQLVAEHYGLPFINIALEVHYKIAAGEFNWNDDFKDLHPAPFGQELYFATIKSLLQTCFAVPAESIRPVAAYSMPKPLNPARFENGEYYNITNAQIDAGWHINPDWKPANGQGTRPGFVNVPMLISEKPGSKLSLKFKGDAIGIAITSGDDAGEISYSIDNGPAKTLDLFTQWSGYLHLPWYLLLGSDLKKGNHTLHIEISPEKNKNSKGNVCRIEYFLLNK